MNLLLMHGGYPPVAVRPGDRKTYFCTLERAFLTGGLGPYLILMHQRLDAALKEYVSVLQEATR